MAIDSKTYDPERDMPSLEGKVVLVTGGTAGLGAGSVSQLVSKNPAHVYFTGRNQSAADDIIAKSKEAAPNVPVTFISTDISSLKSVQAAANSFKGSSDRLDLLMLNAGIMAVPEALSVDGYETQFATNHLGHALLIKLLTPVLTKTAETEGSDVRIVSLSSLAYRMAPSQGIDFDTLKTTQPKLGGFLMPSKHVRYGQSKLANMLYARELAKHLPPQVAAYSVHPGIIKTGLFQSAGAFERVMTDLMFRSQFTPLEQGHYSQCWVATVDKAKLKNGAFYEPVGKLTDPPATKPSKDDALSAKLWDWTQTQLESYD